MAAFKLNASIRAVSLSVRVLPTLRTSTPSALLPMPSSGKNVRIQNCECVKDTWVLFYAFLYDFNNVFPRLGKLFHAIVTKCNVIPDRWLVPTSISGILEHLPCLLIFLFLSGSISKEACGPNFTLTLKSRQAFPIFTSGSSRLQFSKIFLVPTRSACSYLIKACSFITCGTETLQTLSECTHPLHVVGIVNF